jgi:hypothetical protein
MNPKFLLQPLIFFLKEGMDELLSLFIYIYIAIHQLQANNIMLHISLLNYHLSYEQVIILFEILFPKFN